MKDSKRVVLEWRDGEWEFRCVQHKFAEGGSAWWVETADEDFMETKVWRPVIGRRYGYDVTDKALETLCQAVVEHTLKVNEI